MLLLLARDLRFQFREVGCERKGKEDMGVDQVVLIDVEVGVLTYGICNVHLVLAYRMYPFGFSSGCLIIHYLYLYCSFLA